MQVGGHAICSHPASLACIPTYQRVYQRQANPDVHSVNCFTSYIRRWGNGNIRQMACERVCDVTLAALLVCKRRAQSFEPLSSATVQRRAFAALGRIRFHTENGRIASPAQGVSKAMNASRDPGS